ncbi:DSC E3 ubiquitin ligase complex subunit 3 [Grifola frondosa]|uniref:DSC E3 ubiquitin ligase complex subunit 3 n=1 Tax=Grifola frondosa TaxID=5627 RepID=A0A1C7LV19_GRIFR|nr:DSC E3 ubiquitin ligase complex subunit 3 [Grifola frondosa]
MLSEKAKGKQRAVEPESHELEPLAPTKDLIIRFTEGIPDLTIQVGERDAVRSVKGKIRVARPQLTDRRLSWPQMSEGEEEEGKVQTAQLKPLRGFDRLAAAGFSEQDIANIRLQFHTHSAGDYLDQDFENEEEFDEHARVLEEQWIDSLDGAGSASLSQTSSRPPTRSLTHIFWDDDSEHEVMGNAVFSRRMQMGIVVGFILNFLFGGWTYLLAAP